MVKIFFLEIAGIKIRVGTKDEVLPESETSRGKIENFIKKLPLKHFDIVLEVAVVKNLPPLRKRKNLFEVKRAVKRKKRPDLDWVLYRKDGNFVFEGRMSPEYTAVFSPDFTSGKVFLKKKKNQSGWKFIDIIFGPLQLMVMHYLAAHKLGVLVHSSGIRHNGDGFLFVGKSRAGKSTSARLWDSRQEVEVLNDDRIVIRKKGRHFYIYGTPWHGDFSGYPETISASAPLKKLFFIYHHPRNKLTPLRAIEAFNRFFPNIFPVFWDKESMDFTAHFLCEVLAQVPSFGLGFVKEHSVVDYVRKKLTV